MSTQLSPEEFVRVAWVTVHQDFNCSYPEETSTDLGQPKYSYWVGVYHNRNLIKSWLCHPSYAEAFDAAYTFTLDRIEEVRKLREEVAYINNIMGNASEVSPKHCVHRILHRLELILAEKTRGLNMEFIEAYLKEQAK